MKIRIITQIGAFFLTAALFILACKKEYIPAFKPSLQSDDVVLTQTSVAGTVVNEKGVPVEGASVSCGSKTTLTDRYGAFQFINVNISKSNGSVKVEKANYFKAYRNFVTIPGTLNHVRIRMLPKTVNGTIIGTTGGSVSLSGGAKLTLPANAVTDASGNPFDGTVNVSMTWINPSDPNLPEMVMGDLRGITKNGEERGLETFGMIGVELKSNSGQDLKIKTGQKADLLFPIPSGLLANAPAKIDLWHYDETKERWMQEGTATKSGSNYLAQVSHFSFWNCDAPFPVVDFCIKLVDSLSGKGLSNIGVRILRPNGAASYGRTDTAGNVCGKVPRNELLKLQVLNPCNDAISTYNIGPYSSNATNGTIKVFIPQANRIVFKGTVKDCNNTLVTKGHVRIYAQKGQQYIANVINGEYELPVFNCSNESVNYSVSATDLNATQENIPITVTATNGVVNVPVIQACGVSSLRYIEILIDGSPYNFVTPDQINISDTPSNSILIREINIFGSGAAPNGNTSKNVFFRFLKDNSTASKIPLYSCYLSISQSLTASKILTPNPTINLTKYGNSPGSLVEGNFEISMDFQGTPKTVRCTFKVEKR